MLNLGIGAGAQERAHSLPWSSAGKPALSRLRTETVFKTAPVHAQLSVLPSAYPVQIRGLPGLSVRWRTGAAEPSASAFATVFAAAG